MNEKNFDSKFQKTELGTPEGYKNGWEKEMQFPYFMAGKKGDNQDKCFCFQTRDELDDYIASQKQEGFKGEIRVIEWDLENDPEYDEEEGKKRRVGIAEYIEVE